MTSLLPCSARSGLALLSLAAVAVMAGRIRADQPAGGQKTPGGDSEYEKYMQGDLKRAVALLPEATRRFHQEIIDSHIAEFERTENAAHIMLIAQERLPPDEVMPALVQLTQHKNAQARACALYGLTLCGPAAAGAVDRIIQCYNDPDDEVQWRAAEALANIGPAAAAGIERLAARLEQETDYPRQTKSALIALAKLGPLAKSALPAIQRHLNHPKSEVAYEAFLAMGAIRNDPPLSAQEAAALKSDDMLGPVGFRLLRSLGETRPLPPTGIATLRQVLSQKPAAAVQVMTTKALAGAASLDASTVGVLLKGVSSDDAFVSQTAADALAGAAQFEPSTLAVFATALSPSNEQVAMAAALGLTRFGPAAAPQLQTVIDTLEHCTGDVNYELVGAYLDILRSMGKAAAPAVPTLTAMLPETAQIYSGQDDYAAQDIRKYLLVTLCELGITAQATPAIVDLLANAHTSDQIAAGARAAGALPGGFEALVPHLIKVLETPGLDFGTSLDSIFEPVSIPPKSLTSPYLEAVRALAKMGTAARPAIPVLQKRAADPVATADYYPLYQKEAADAVKTISK